MMPVAMKTLPFKLNLKNWIEKLQGLPPVLRTGVLALGGFLLLLLVYFAAVEPLINLEKDWSQELNRKEQILTHYEALLANKDKVAERLQALQTMLAAPTNRCWRAATPLWLRLTSRRFLKT